MKKIAFLLALVCFIPIPSSSPKYDSVRIQIPASKGGSVLGTGFRVDNHVVTAGHVCAFWLEDNYTPDGTFNLDNPMKLQLINGFGQYYDIALAYPSKVIYNKDIDLCELTVIQGNLDKITGLEFAKKDADVGDLIFVKGYPLGVNYNITSGFVGSPFSLTKTTLSAAIQGGNSGSPVLNKKGQVVGVLVAGFRGTDHSNIMINLFTFRKFLDS